MRGSVTDYKLFALSRLYNFKFYSCYRFMSAPKDEKIVELNDEKCRDDNKKEIDDFDGHKQVFVKDLEMPLLILPLYAKLPAKQQRKVRSVAIYKVKGPKPNLVFFEETLRAKIFLNFDLSLDSLLVRKLLLIMVAIIL